MFYRVIAKRHILNAALQQLAQLPVWVELTEFTETSSNVAGICTEYRHRL